MIPIRLMYFYIKSSTALKWYNIFQNIEIYLNILSIKGTHFFHIPSKSLMIIIT